MSTTTNPNAAKLAHLTEVAAQYREGDPELGPVEGARASAVSTAVLHALTYGSSIEEVSASFAAALPTPEPSVTLTEVDLVEVIGALEIAASVHGLTGGTVMREHFTALAQRLSDTFHA
jgi:hypothetical protein